MRIAVVLVAVAVAAAGCGGRPAPEQRLADLAGVRDARVSAEEVDDGQTETTATVDMEAGATEAEIARAVAELAKVDALFRDVVVDAGSVERPTGDGLPGIYRVEPGPGQPSAASLARWFVTATTRFPDATVQVGLNDTVEIRLGKVGVEAVARAADTFVAEPRLRGVGVRITGGRTAREPAGDLLGRPEVNPRLAGDLRALARVVRESPVPVPMVGVWQGPGRAAALRVTVDLGDVEKVDLTPQRFPRVLPVIGRQLDLLRTLPARSSLTLEQVDLGPTFLAVQARPRPRGLETYASPDWNAGALRYLRSPGG